MSVLMSLSSCPTDWFAGSLERVPPADAPEDMPADAPDPMAEDPEPMAEEPDGML
jgi:hypothetical protein